MDAPTDDLVLGIDTSGILGGVALACGGRLLAETRCDARAAASERILPQIERLLADIGMKRDRIARVGAALGPGSFTGLRVGLATAHGLCRGLEVPLVAVSSLSARAYAVGAGGRGVLVATARRQGQLFCGALFWDAGRCTTLLEEGSRAVAEAADWIATAHRAARTANRLPLIVTGDALESLRGGLERAAPPAELLCLPGLPGSVPGAVALIAGLAGASELLIGESLAGVSPRYLRGSYARPPATGRGTDP